MGEIDFAKKIIKILDVNILQMIIKKAVEKGFEVRGFTKNVWKAPETSICAALERRKKGKYQSSIFLEALNEIEVDDEIIDLAKKWLEDKGERDEIERKIEQVSLEKTEKKVITEEKNVRENIKKKKNENYENEIQQLQTKNKELKSKIQDLKIGIENYQNEILQLQKENDKFSKKIDKKTNENKELEEKISILKEDIKKLEYTLDLFKQENIKYQEIFKKAPKVLCFSKRNINKDNFPFYNLKQLYKWLDEYEDIIKPNEYQEIWIIETDFSYSEVVKMKRLPCDKIILKSSIKSLIEKVGGFRN